MKVGIVGCGVIARQYARNGSAFDSFEIVACADAARPAAEALAAEHGFAVAAVEELIADPAIDVVLNLTPPVAHAAVIRQALEAGKHVYSEKPLARDAHEAATLVAEAERRGLRVGCAPDTFLSGPYQAARALIDAGAIGTPLSASIALLIGNQAAWHPNPDIFVAEGAGPLLDFAPYFLTALVALLGPVREVTGFAETSTAEQKIAIGPRAGERFRASTPTHAAAALRLEGGALAGMIASFETDGHYVRDFSIHGTEGVLALPDPNDFTGPLRLRQGTGDFHDVEVATRGAREARGIGLHDMMEAIVEGRPHRASDRLAHHVLDVAHTILTAAAAGEARTLETRVDRPAPLPVGSHERLS